MVLRRDGRNLTLIPDTDPTATTVATNITLDRYSADEEPLVIANGWTVRHTEALPEDEGDLEFTPVSGWHAQAVTLDSLVACGQEDDGVESDFVGEGAGDVEVAVVDGVEGAAEKSDVFHGCPWVWGVRSVWVSDDLSGLWVVGGV